METSFFLIKPDAVRNGYVKKIIEFLEKRGFKVLARETRVLSRRDIMFLYPMHIKEVFFNNIVAFMDSGPSEILMVQRDSATEILNRLVGVTDPQNNSENTLRYRFGTDLRHNAVHSPNSEASAAREILYFFPKWQRDV
ncbi:nucleoside-diphosphate kinase [Patescibacteria group bacterium]|nr:nucleoside-diphosphate kinase [Patescibacteria group bacterium]MBU4031086.1 nucleoside-diphosphate kinase [Patescibacteria group bacterium]MCG2699749.1 nucleoside-diphosphate kinase [Candidatus Parcubacteria bacterium]MCG2809575.1 nucleoside-diphosphate kinase [Candidatus Portnoybacteria bacterium]